MRSLGLIRSFIHATLALACAASARAATVDVQTFRFQATDPWDVTGTKINFDGVRDGGLFRGYGLDSEINEGLSQEVHYHGLRGTGHARLEPSRRTTVLLNAGASRLANAYPEAEADGADAEILVGEEQTIPVFGAAVQFTERTYDLRAEVGHDFVYEDWAQPRAAVDLVNGTKFGVSGSSKLSTRTHLAGNVALVELSDRNQQRTGDGSLMTDVWSGRDQLRLGVGVWYDDLRELDGGYWTPRNFAAYTGRAEATVNWSKIIALNLNTKLGSGGERLRAHDPLYSVTAKLEYRPSPVWHLTVGYARAESYSPRGASTWYRNDLNATLSASL